jgi:hypothetical protein
MSNLQKEYFRTGTRVVRAPSVPWYGDSHRTLPYNGRRPLPLWRGAKRRSGALTCAVDPPGAMRARSFYQATCDGWFLDHRIETISGNGSHRDEASGRRATSPPGGLVLLYAVAARGRAPVGGAGKGAYNARQSQPAPSYPDPNNRWPMIESAGNAERDAGARRAAPAGRRAAAGRHGDLPVHRYRGQHALVGARCRARCRLALAQHHAILRPAIEANGGHVYQVIGDAFQAAFRLAGGPGGLRRSTARAAGRELGPNRPAARADGAAHRPGRDRPAGQRAYEVCHTLNRAARMMSAGHGGQIC